LRNIEKVVLELKNNQKDDIFLGNEFQLKKYCPLWLKNYRNEKVGKFISDFILREV